MKGVCVCVFACVCLCFFFCSLTGAELKSYTSKYNIIFLQAAVYKCCTSLFAGVVAL